MSTLLIGQTIYSGETMAGLLKQLDPHLPESADYGEFNINIKNYPIKNPVTNQPIVKTDNDIKIIWEYLKKGRTEANGMNFESTPYTRSRGPAINSTMSGGKSNRKSNRKYKRKSNRKSNRKTKKQRKKRNKTKKRQLRKRR